MVADMPVRFPNDSIMAPPAYVRQVRAWAREVLTGDRVEDGRIRIRVLRQDHSWLRCGRSAIETPLKIGAQSFKHGLGTHAFSDLEVEIPDGAQRFEASIGVDNNENTGGVRGSVEFVVEVDGEEMLRSPVLKGGAAAVPVVVRIPRGARILRLKVTDGGDGLAFDQADWADAAFVMADGSHRYLDDGQPDLPVAPDRLPISFILGGKRSTELLPGWRRTYETHSEPGAERIVVKWEEPGPGIVLTVEARVFDRYPAVEWVARFENRGAAASPILEDVQTLDLAIASGYVRRPLVLHHLQGDTCSATSFMPLQTLVEPEKPVRLAPTGGRPSSMTAFPFWNLQYEDAGLITGVGWTGQWQADFVREATGPASMRVGLETLRTTLMPGEAIRTPRVVIMPWKGSRADAHSRFRRLMFEHFTPRVGGRLPTPPLAMQTFDRYNGHPDWATETGQLIYARKAADLGFDTLWLDAAWFPGGFPNGVGSWRADETRFPRGLKPVADAVHAQKMRFVLWFEPERVAPGSDIAREHPEWVSGGANGGLFRLHDPEARRWLTDTLIQRIEEYGVDVYRNDFNMDPLPHWRAEDAPDRQGITEIRYVEGLYEMWDALRTHYANLLIDNCSSGGRRLDLEMMMRSIPLWRSDTGCWAGHPEWNQMQSMALAQYLPLFTVGLWSADPYERRSAGTAGASVEVPYLEPGFDPKPWAEAVAELKELRRFWFGDFYALSGNDTALDGVAAWQLHRADTNEGVIYAFRRPESGLGGIVVIPRSIKPSVAYTVRFRTDGKATVQTMTGKQMAEGIVLRLPHAPGSVVVTYAPAPAAKPMPTRKEAKPRA
jgi:alpha-galactosidase